MIYSYNKSQRDALISQTCFWNRSLHVSGRFSVHHQESSAVYTAIGICHTYFIRNQDGNQFHPNPASKQSA